MQVWHTRQGILERNSLLMCVMTACGASEQVTNMIHIPCRVYWSGGLVIFSWCFGKMTRNIQAAGSVHKDRSLSLCILVFAISCMATCWHWKNLLAVSSNMDWRFDLCTSQNPGSHACGSWASWHTWTSTLVIISKEALTMGSDSWRRRVERTEADSVVSPWFHLVAWVLLFVVCVGGVLCLFLLDSC